MATTGGSSFVLNIVELQNTITAASGLSPVASLSNTVAQLQEMVIYDEKRIAVNTISKYNTTPIQVIDSMNFASNTTLTLNGTSVSGASTTSLGQVSSIGYASSFTNYYTTAATTDTAVAFQVGSPPIYPLSVTGAGATLITGGLTLSGAGSPSLGYYLTCMDASGRAEWKPPGSVSDARLKREIRPLEDSARIFSGLRGVRFQWLNGSNDVGVIAQEVGAVLPEAVHVGVGSNPSVVEYHKIIPVLIEVVKGLEARLSTLEG
jgi:hypothetical protein